MAGSSTFFDGYYNPDASENPKISGVQVGFGFKYQAQAPLDGRLVVRSYEELEQLVAEKGAYPGMIVYVTNYDSNSSEEPKGQLYYFDGYVDDASVLHGNWIVFSQTGQTTNSDIITSKILLISEDGTEYVLIVEDDGTLGTEDYDNDSEVVDDTVLLKSTDGTLFALGVTNDGSLTTFDYEGSTDDNGVTTDSVVLTSEATGKKYILSVQNDGSLTTSEYHESSSDSGKGETTTVAKPIVQATSTDGINYHVTLDDIPEPYVGLEIAIIPNMTSTSQMCILTVDNWNNDVAEGGICMGFTQASSDIWHLEFPSAHWLQEGDAVTLKYTSKMTWLVDSFNYVTPYSIKGEILVKNGGTGLYQVTAGNFLVGNGTESMIEKTPAEVLEAIGAAPASHTHTASDIGGATTFTKTVSVDTSWTADTTNGGYKKIISVDDILATDTPVIDVVLSDDITASKAALKAWGYIDRVTTADGSITLYAYSSQPTTAIQIQLKVVR